MHMKLWKEILKKRRHLEDLGTDGKIIFIWILKREHGRCGLDARGSIQGPMVGEVNSTKDRK